MAPACRLAQHEDAALAAEVFIAVLIFNRFILKLQHLQYPIYIYSFIRIYVHIYMKNGTVLKRGRHPRKHHPIVCLSAFFKPQILKLR